MSLNQLNLAQKQPHFKKLKGFTLAEVLITLGIIGIVAAITIPTLMQNTQDSELKAAYKKAFSDASSVWQQMRANNEIEPWSDPDNCDENSTSKNLVTFRSYMKVATSCGNDVTNDNVLGCWDVNGEGFNDVFGGSASSRPSRPAGLYAIGFVDTAGRDWVMLSGQTTCTVSLMVDTNGFKSPNKIGRDRFFIRAGRDDGTFGLGTYTRLFPDIDRNAVGQRCGYPPCYGTSWLYN